MKTMVIGGLMLALASGAASAQSTPAPQGFVTAAAVANKFEIDSSKVALERSSTDGVKQFAQQMIDDHTKAGEELERTVSKLGGLSVPDALDAEHMASLSALSDKAGIEFDQAYIAIQTRAHDDAVGLFSTYADSGTPPDLKAFAARMLPILKMHRDHVRRLAAAAPPPPAPKPETSGANTPVEGADSFTQTQTRCRREQVDGGLDFKGNVIVR